MLRLRGYIQSSINLLFNYLSPTWEIHHNPVPLLNAYILDYSLSIHSTSAIACNGVNKVHFCCINITLNIIKTSSHVCVHSQCWSIPHIRNCYGIRSASGCTCSKCLFTKVKILPLRICFRKWDISPDVSPTSIGRSLQ